MTSRHERWLQWKAWRLQQPGWLIALLLITLSLLFWLSAALLIWLLSTPRQLELPAA
jgi:uncharacterized membrane protein YbhN (UPF0104 family)